MRHLTYLSALVIAALLWGCGSSHDAPAGAAAAPAQVARKPAAPSEADTRNMVTAVRQAKPNPLPVQLKFELAERPGVSQPLEVALAIIPVSGTLDRIAGKVEGEDGLEIVEGGEIAAVDRPAEGVAIRHAIKVLPLKNGISTLNAVLTLNSGGQSTSETFAIPVITGPGQPDAPAKSAEARAQPAASGSGTTSPAGSPPAAGSGPGSPTPAAAAQ